MSSVQMYTKCVARRSRFVFNKDEQTLFAVEDQQLLANHGKIPLRTVTVRTHGSALVDNFCQWSPETVHYSRGIHPVPLASDPLLPIFAPTGSGIWLYYRELLSVSCCGVAISVA